MQITARSMKCTTKLTAACRMRGAAGTQWEQSRRNTSSALTLECAGNSITPHVRTLCLIIRSWDFQEPDEQLCVCGITCLCVV